MPRPEQFQFLIYPPSKELLEEWRAASKEFGTSLNNYIIQMVEKARHTEPPRADLSLEVSDLKEEINKLRDELRIKSMLLEKYETELYKMRYKNFTEEDNEGLRRYSDELIKILKRGRAVDGYSILRALGIDSRDTEAVKLVSNQLEDLRNYHLVEETNSGWRWIG